MDLGEQLAIPFRIEFYERLSSTQDAMKKRLLRGEAVHGLVIRAGEQTLGRGRRDHGWQSGPGGSYQTLALRDPAPPSLRRGASALAVALGLAEVFPRYGVRLGLKWPNDIYFRGKKLAGILCEYSRGHLLVGVGVNVANDIPDGAAALRGWDPEGADAVVLEGIQHGLALLLSGNDIAARYGPHDLLLDQPVTVEAGDQVHRGTARGITADGCLRLAVPGGAVKQVCEGHLSAFRLSSERK